MISHTAKEPPMSPLSRRALVAGAVIASMPLPVLAEATPGATPVAVLVGLEGTASRAFALPDTDAPGLVRVEGYAFQFQSPLLIDPALSSLVAATVLDRPVSGDVRESDITIGPVGNERAAILVEVDAPDVDTCGIVTVQRTWVQVIVGYGTGAIAEQVGSIATAIVDRWPSDNLEDALPTMDDVSAGMIEVDD